MLIIRVLLPAPAIAQITAYAVAATVSQGFPTYCSTLSSTAELTH